MRAAHIRNSVYSPADTAHDLPDRQEWYGLNYYCGTDVHVRRCHDAICPVSSERLSMWFRFDFDVGFDIAGFVVLAPSEPALSCRAGWGLTLLDRSRWISGTRGIEEG